MKTRSFAAFISLILITLVAGVGLPQTVAEMRKGFETPPADTRIMMRWWWFGPAVTKAEIERELRVMKEGGIGGVEVQPVYPLLPDDPKTGFKNLPYLSDEFLDMLKFASVKAKELGMRFDLTLGSGWSFGGAKTPITEAAGQLRVERVKVDVGAKRIPLPSMIPAEKLMAVFISAKGGNTIAEGDLKELKDIREDNVFLPTPGTAGSEVLFFISGKSGMQVKRPSFGAEGYVLNHLDKPSVDNYLRQTGDRLFTAFNKADVPYSVFCDSLEVYNQDWTDDFLAEFQKRRGYDLKPHLPALVAETGSTTADIRYDWGRTITELFNDRFMVPMQAWSKANGTKFRIQGYGLPPAAISSNQWADISDGEGAQWKVVRAARWASSANHVYGRNVTSSETWTWLNSPVFRATPLDLKAEADIHFLQGINQLIGHGWGYTPPGVEYPGWRFYAAGAYSEQNPWFIVMPDLAAYLQRMSFVLRQGMPKNDIALYLPNADAYAHFTAGKVHLIDVEREMVGEKIMPAIFEAGYNLDFFDDEMLRTVGKAEQGTLALGAGKHPIVVLPGIERMPLESLRKLDAFVKGGGKLVATRRLPEKVPGVKATDAEKAEFTAIAGRLFGGGNDSVKFVAKDEEIGAALRSLLQPDAEIAPSGVDLGTVHRKVGDSDIYFVANTSNQKKNLQVKFRVAVGQAEVWDALKGKAFAANIIGQDAKTTTIDLSLEPYGSAVVIFSKDRSAAGKIPLYAVADSSIDLSSDWNVSFDGKSASKFSSLRSWDENEATRYFSGTAAYERTVDVPAGFLKAGNSAVLDLGEGKAVDVIPQRNGMRTFYDPPVREAAVIYVNGQKAGSLWCPPYKLDVSKYVRPGSNSLKIVVGNTALNYMSGRKLPDYKLLNLRFGERFQPQEMEKIQPLPSGLIGNVRLFSAK
ncbi:MAG: glycosyl hydrolase [Pyrinomonadaceae bacterium]